MEKAYLGSEVADACLQEVVLHGPLHEVVVDGLSANALVVVDGLVVVPFQSGQVCHLQEMLVGETSNGQQLEIILSNSE